MPAGRFPFYNLKTALFENKGEKMPSVKNLFFLFLTLLSAAPLWAGDSGFRPDEDGFGFPNYANEENIENLTPAEVVRMFGPAANAAEEGEEIELVPAAQQWMEDVNELIDIGHCEGMAVLSLLFHLGVQNPEKFGAETVNELKLQGNTALQREIAYWWATQLTDTTHERRLRLTPSQIVEQLRQGLATEDPEKTYSIGIWMANGSGGHAVTPYAVVDAGADKAKIMVYDNNFPDQERFIEVDCRENTWRYSTAVNPTQPTNDYVGNAQTGTLMITPCSARLQLHTADFLEEAAWAEDEEGEEDDSDDLEPGDEVADDDEEAADADDADEADEDENGNTGAVAASVDRMRSTPSERGWTVVKPFKMELTLAGSGVQMLITDNDGKRTGYDKGAFVNEIPDVDVVRIIGGWKLVESPQPKYRLPAGRDYKISLTRINDASESVSLSCLGRGTSLEIDDITIDKGQVDTMFFSPDGSRVVYRPAGDEHPSLSIGFQGKKHDYEISVYGVETSPGASIELEIMPKIGCARLQVYDSKIPATVEVEARRIGGGRQAVFRNDELTLEPNSAAYLHFAAWKGENAPLKISIDKEGNGKIDSKIEQQNKWILKAK